MRGSSSAIRIRVTACLRAGWPVQCPTPACQLRISRAVPFGPRSSFARALSRRVSASRACPPPSWTGWSSTKRLPLPTSDSSRTLPPCASAMALTIESPSPEPSDAAELRPFPKRSNMRSWSSARNAGAGVRDPDFQVLSQCRLRCRARPRGAPPSSFSAQAAPTEIRSVSDVCLTALAASCSSAWVSRRRSARTRPPGLASSSPAGARRGP